MPLKKRGLFLDAVTEGVHAELAEHERSVAHDVLQAEEILAERFAVVEVNVERGKVEEGQVKIFRRREVGVRDETGGIVLLADIRQFGNEALDPLRAVPADNVRRDLVAHAVAEDAVVPAPDFGGLADRSAGMLLRLRISDASPTANYFFIDAGVATSGPFNFVNWI